MKVASYISWKKLDDRIVVVNTDNGVYYTMNPTASAIWEAMTEGLDARAIAARLRQQYEVAEADALADAREQLDAWAKEALITE